MSEVFTDKKSVILNFKSAGYRRKFTEEYSPQREFAQWNKAKTSAKRNPHGLIVSEVGWFWFLAKARRRKGSLGSK